MSKNKKMIYDILIILLGNFFLVCSVVYFIIPFNILSGGVAGVAVALQPILPVSEQFTINFLIISMFILGTIFLGKEFALKTFLSSAVYPIYLFILNKFPLQINIDPVLASVYAGVLGGLGIGIVFRVDASTGGMDIPALIVNKFTKIPLGTLVMIVDALTILLGLKYHGLERVLVGLVSVYTTSTVVNNVMVAGGHAAKTTLIISSKYQEISEKLQEQLQRGVTLIPAKGGYQLDDRPMLLSVVASNQYPKLHDLVYGIDPTAFFVVIDTTEVKGEGFSFDYKI